IATYKADVDVTNPSQTRINAANSTAQQFYTNQTAHGTNVQLLQTNLATEKNLGKMDQTQVNALMSVYNDKLNGKEMNKSGAGVSMNDQISKAIAATCSADFQNACAAKNAAGIAQVMKNAFNADRITDAMSSTSATGQNPSTPAGAASTPAGAGAAH